MSMDFFPTSSNNANQICFLKSAKYFVWLMDFIFF